MAPETAVRTCPLCEATCGLEIELEGRTATAIRGDPDDVFSRGFVCPKGASLAELQDDPDRLRTPLVRRDGELREASWEEAYAAIEAGLAPILAAGDRNAIAVYLGNPNAHTLDGLVHLRALTKAIGTRNVYSASTVDQMPKQVAAGLMFGAGLTIPVPDVDRTDHLLLLGANPLASNGSLLTAPDMRGRLRRLRERGGKLVVVDPRRSRTAEVADEHHFIRPGRDAHLLAAIAVTLADEGLADPGRLAEHLNGLEGAIAALEPFTPERSAEACGIPAAEIRRMAHELAAAERAAVYARIGTTTQEFGTLASWLVDLVNVLTGNLDRAGGAMFTRAAAGARNASGPPGRGRGVEIGRWHSRVRGLPETFGELPAACLAEEIETPGEGQVRALLTVAGNPAVSLPNSTRLERALGSLELMVSVDMYVNETTRHADVVLPPPSPLERPHYDLALYQLAVRNVANYSPALLPLEEGLEPEWRTFLRLAGIVAGQGPNADVDALDRMVALGAIGQQVSTPGSPIEGSDPEEVLASLEPRTGPERVLDLLLRCGPYGEWSPQNGDRNGGAAPALSLSLLEANPHGIDLGPLEPRIPEILRTPTGKVELLPEPIREDVERLRASLDREQDGLVLIGRRQLRSNNSWMHNLPHLVRGPDRCTLHVHPSDAARHGLADGKAATVRSRVGAVEVPVEVTDAIMPGVVSIPHGWGHDAPGVRMRVASEHPGVNSNLLADEELVDAPSGNAVLNGIPVRVEPVPAPAPA